MTKGFGFIGILITIAVLGGVTVYVVNRNGGFDNVDIENPINNIDAAIDIQNSMNSRDAEIQAELDKQ